MIEKFEREFSPFGDEMEDFVPEMPNPFG